MKDTSWYETVIDDLPDLLAVFGRVPTTVVRDALSRRSTLTSLDRDAVPDIVGVRCARTIRWFYGIATNRWIDDNEGDGGMGYWKDVFICLRTILSPNGSDEPVILIGWERWIRTMTAFWEGSPVPIGDCDPYALDALVVLYLSHVHNRDTMVTALWTKDWQRIIMDHLVATITAPSLGMTAGGQEMLASGTMTSDVFGHERTVQYYGGHPIMMGLVHTWSRARIDPLQWLDDPYWSMIHTVITHTIGPRRAVVERYRDRTDDLPVMIAQWLSPTWIEYKGGKWRCADPRIEEVPMHDPLTGRTWMSSRAIPLQRDLQPVWEILDDVINRRDWNALTPILGLSLKLYPVRGMPVGAVEALDAAIRAGMPISHAEQLWATVLERAVLTTDRYADLSVEAAVHVLGVPWPVGDPRCRQDGMDGVIARMQAVIRSAWEMTTKPKTLVIVNYHLIAWFAYSYPALLDAETYLPPNPTDHDWTVASDIAAFVRRCCRWIHTGLAPYEIDVIHEPHPITSAVVLSSIRAATLLNVLDGPDADILPYTLAWHVVSSHDPRLTGTESAWMLPRSVATIGGWIDAISAEGAVISGVRIDAVWREPRLDWVLLHQVQANRMTLIGGSASASVWIGTAIRDGWMIGIDMRKSMWDRCQWTGVTGQSVSMPTTLMIRPDMRSLTMHHLDMDGSVIVGGSYQATTWIDSRFCDTMWYRTTIRGSRFVRGTMAGACFRECLIIDTVWEDVEGLASVDWIGTSLYRVTMPPGIRGHTIRTIAMPSVWSGTGAPVVLMMVLRTPARDPEVLAAATLVRESLDSLVATVQHEMDMIQRIRDTADTVSTDTADTVDTVDTPSLPILDPERWQMVRSAIATLEQSVAIFTSFAAEPIQTILSIPGVYRLHLESTGRYTVQITDFYPEVLREIVDLITTYHAHPDTPTYDAVRRIWTDRIGMWIIERTDQLRDLARQHHPWATANAACMQAIMLPTDTYPRTGQPWLVADRDGAGMEVTQETIAWCRCPLLDDPPIPQPEPSRWELVMDQDDDTVPENRVPEPGTVDGEMDTVVPDGWDADEESADTQG